jgi:hypothetical protein
MSANRQPEGHPGRRAPIIRHDSQATVPLVELAAGKGLPDIEETVEEKGRQKDQRRPLAGRHQQQPEGDTRHFVPDD